MRILLSVFIWVLFIGGLLLHLASRDKIETVSGSPYAEPPTEAGYSLEVTPGFTAMPDPFALASEDERPVPVLTARLGGRELLAMASGVEDGVPIILDPLEGIVAGVNELYVEATPPSSAGGGHHALRLRIFKGAAPLSEKTLWSAPGEGISGVLRFTAAEKKTEEDHDHH